jgi:subtilisin family serine protease
MRALDRVVRARRAAIVRSWAACLCAAIVLAAAPDDAGAARHTPAAWRHLVPEVPASRFSGQRKNTIWIRDRDGDFIDDAMPRGKPSVDVVVELNDCFQPAFLERRFERFGRISYIGRLLSCLYLQGVRSAMLDTIAVMPEVAMVEWQTPLRPSMGVSVRSSQAAPSETYGEDFARTFDGTDWSGVTGEGVNIAILDMGVANGDDVLPSKGTSGWVAGFDATTTTDIDVVDEDPDNDGPGEDHSTRVASVALGRRPGDVACYWTDSDDVAPDCAGVAPEAGLIDVKVWDIDITREFEKLAPEDRKLENVPSFMRGLDWVGVHHDDPSFRIHVVNISLSDMIDCDGLCAACQAVNYLAALGVTPVVGHGNAGEGMPETDRRLVPSVGASSYAITVAGANDLNTVPRSDDLKYTYYLEGGRHTKSGADTTPYGEKPDLAAPAENIMTRDFYKGYSEASGTSLAAPHVAGAAALLLQANPALGPADVKDILRRTADGSRNPDVVDDWDPKFGMGLLNVYDALHLAKSTDLRFVSCIEPWTEYGSPCNLTGSLPNWLNTIDVTVDPDPPEEGVPTTLRAAIYNDGSAEATDFLVTFGYYEFGTGTQLFHEIETKRVDRVAGYASETVECAWTPVGSGHQCIQVTIQYGLDTEHGNNVTQRNFTVEASRYDMRIENPYMRPARFYVRTVSEAEGWPCVVSEPEFRIGGPEDCAKTVQIGFRAPRRAAANARANCHVYVYARPDGSSDSVLVGGVTVQTYVPGECRIIGQVVDPRGRGVQGAELTFVRDVPSGVLRAEWERDRRIRTDRDGIFDLRMPPGVHHTLKILTADGMDWHMPVRPKCGVGVMRIQVSKSGVRLIR